MAGNEKLYWLIAVPPTDNPTNFVTLKRKVNEENRYCEINNFKIPSLKVGTLDTLMQLSEDLVKVDSFVEQVTKKIGRQALEIDKESKKSYDEKSISDLNFQVNDTSLDSFITRFRWEDAKYSTQTPMREVADTIQASVNKLDEELRTKMSEYANLKTQRTTVERKAGGNLMLKDLSEFVHDADVAESENITTLFAIIPGYLEKEWLSSYAKLLEGQITDEDVKSEKNDQEKDKAKRSKKEQEEKDKLEQEEKAKLTKEEKDKLEQEEKAEKKLLEEEKKKKWEKLVLIGSSKKLAEDNEYILYSVVLFKRVADRFKAVAREKRFNIREFKYDEKQLQSSKDEKNKMDVDFKQKQASLDLWTKTNFGEAFSAWLHIKAIRVFVESVLRFSLPVNFESFILQVNRKYEKQLKTTLKQLYSNLGGSKYSSMETDVETPGNEFYPYVFQQLSF